MVVPGLDKQAHGMGGGLEKGHQRVGFVSHSSQCLVNEVALMLVVAMVMVLVWW